MIVGTIMRDGTAYVLDDGNALHNLIGSHPYARKFKAAFGGVQAWHVGKRIYATRGFWRLETDTETANRLACEADGI